MGVFGRRHAANRKAVSLVNIGHDDHMPNQPGQGCRVERLLQRFVIDYLLEQGTRGKQLDRHAHVVSNIGRNLPFSVTDLNQILDIHLYLSRPCEGYVDANVSDLPTFAELNTSF